MSQEDPQPKAYFNCQNETELKEALAGILDFITNQKRKISE